MPVSSLNARGQRILVALPTMFTPDGGLDLDACAQAASLVADSRADGAFVAGTTGEFLALEPDERLTLFQTQRDALQDKRIVGHIGSGSARQAITLLEESLSLGITEFAAITPYYLPATPAATLAYYTALSEAAAGRARIYVYLFEARTSTQVSPVELARLAEVEGIVGVKVSGENLDTVMSYRDATPPDFEVFTGNDADFPQAASHGLDGVVSGVSACFPATFDRMVSALASADAAQIEGAQADVLRSVDLIAGDIGRIKLGLGVRGIGTSTVRMAIESPPAALKAAIVSAAQELENV